MEFLRFDEDHPGRPVALRTAPVLDMPLAEILPVDGIGALAVLSVALMTNYGMSEDGEKPPTALLN